MRRLVLAALLALGAGASAFAQNNPLPGVGIGGISNLALPHRTLIATGTANNTSPSIAFTGLAPGGFPSYVLKCWGLQVGVADQIDVQFAQGAATWKATGYDYNSVSLVGAGTSPNNAHSGSTTGLRTSSQNQINIGDSFALTLEFPNLTSGTDIKSARGEVWFEMNTPAAWHSWFSGSYNADLTPMTGVRVTTATGLSNNLKFGTCNLYGESP